VASADTSRFLNEEVTEQQRLLLASSQALDTRATFLAGFAAAVILFLLQNRRGPLWIAALIAYFIGLGLAVATLWPREGKGLSPEALVDELAELELAAAIGQVVGTKRDIFTQNQLKEADRTRLWKGSVLALIIGTAFLVPSTFIESRHDRDPKTEKRHPRTSPSLHEGQGANGAVPGTERSTRTR
jgi:hypothetical protein